MFLLHRLLLPAAPAGHADSGTAKLVIPLAVLEESLYPLLNSGARLFTLGGKHAHVLHDVRPLLRVKRVRRLERDVHVVAPAVGVVGLAAVSCQLIALEL